MKHFKLLLASLALMGAADATAQSIGDIIEIDGKRYEVTSDNLIYNPSFEDGVDGWYSGAWNNASASNYTLQAEGGFDGGAYLQYSAGGATADSNIRNSWSVSKGETYLFRCYTSGKTPNSNNLQYSKLWASKDGAEETTQLYQLQWGVGANQTTDAWTENNYVFTATTDYVVFRSSWTENSKLDGFFLGTIQLYIDDTAYQAALDAANDAISDPVYSNVSGDELTALQNAIDTYSDATPEQFEEAIRALDEATTAFKAAKTNYDNFVNAINDYPYANDSYYGTSEKWIAMGDIMYEYPTTSAEAAEKTAAYFQALRAAYESHALAENYDGATNVTNLIQNPNATDGNNGWTWTGNKNAPRNTESWTDSNGKHDYMYFDGGNWNGTGWTTTMEQTISLPAGIYLLTAKGRASDGVTLTMSVGENNVALPNVNASGNVFNFGWNDGSIEFETQGEDITIKINATTEGNHQWFSVGDFRLIRLVLNEEMADAADYAALNEAIAAAEANKLGFDAGEYAPYNNVEAIKALAAAKRINPEAEDGNSKEAVQNATAALNNAEWVANTEEVNAIFDGSFLTDYSAQSGNVQPIGWYREKGTENDGYNVRYMGGSNAGLAATSTSKALFTKTAAFYGWADGYTMPLDANTAYEISFVYGGWSDCKKDGFVTIRDAEGNNIELTANRLPLDAVDGDSNPDSWKTYKAYFTTGEAGDYVLGLRKDNERVQSQYVYGDFKLVKAVVEDIVLNDAATEIPAEAFGNVTYARKLVAEYNTLVLPFNVKKEELGENVEAIYAYGGSTKEGEGENAIVHLDFTQAVENLAANTPYIVKMSADQEGLSFTNKAVAPVADPIVADANFDFVGTYVELPAGNDVITSRDYISVKSGLKQATAGKQLKAFRAYLKNKSEEAVGAKVSIMIGGEVVDGIQAAQILNNVDGTIYNLNGQKVSNAQKGIFIQNGKKVVIK